MPKSSAVTSKRLLMLTTTPRMMRAVATSTSVEWPLSHEIVPVWAHTERLNSGVLPAVSAFGDAHDVDSRRESGAAAFGRRYVVAESARARSSPDQTAIPRRCIMTGSHVMRRHATRAAWLLGITFLVVSLTTKAALTEPESRGSWSETWVSMPQLTEPGNLPPPPFTTAGGVFIDSTVRQTLHTSVAG